MSTNLKLFWIRSRKLLRISSMLFLLFVAASFVLTACSNADNEPVTPTGASAPTEAPVPTETVEPTPPDPIIFFDDFEGSIDPFWNWINEDPERWRLTDDGWLEITAANPGFVTGDDGDIREINLLAREAPESSFTLTPHLFSSPWDDDVDNTML